MASYYDYYAANNGGKQGTTATQGTYGNGSGYNLPGGAPSYIKSNYDMSGYKNVSDWSKSSGISPSQVKVADTRNFNYTTPSNNDRGGGYYGGGYGGGYDIGYEQPDYSAWFNALMSIKDAQYNAVKDSIAKARQRALSTENMNDALSRRQADKAFKNTRNGQGLSTFATLGARHAKNTADINNTYDQMDNANIGDRFNGLYGMTSMLSNMDNNTIKKIMGYLG